MGEDRGLGRVFLETGVKPRGVPIVEVAGQQMPENYRTPDMSFLRPTRSDRFQGGWIVGGPDVVLEVVSPGDESREKLPFYFSVGLLEVVFVDRDSYSVEVLRAGASAFEPVAADAAGWIACATLETELRREEVEGKPRLHIRCSGDPARELAIDE